MEGATEICLICVTQAAGNGDPCLGHSPGKMATAFSQPALQGTRTKADDFRRRVGSPYLFEQPPPRRRSARRLPRGFGLRRFRIQVGEDLLDDFSFHQ